MLAVCVINLINDINAVSLQTSTFFEPLPSANSSLLLPHAQPNLALFALRRRRNSSKSTSVFCRLLRSPLGVSLSSGALTKYPLQAASNVNFPQGCQMAKFDPFLSLDCAPSPSTLAWRNPRKRRDQILPSGNRG